ncbi:MAG TPA: hypothetical protein VGG32_04575, partial [Thermoplasmata archaeon]
LAIELGHCGLPRRILSETAIPLGHHSPELRIVMLLDAGLSHPLQPLGVFVPFPNGRCEIVSPFRSRRLLPRSFGKIQFPIRVVRPLSSR